LSDAVDQIDAASACRTDAGKTTSIHPSVVTDAFHEDPFAGLVNVTGAGYRSSIPEFSVSGGRPNHFRQTFVGPL